MQTLCINCENNPNCKWKNDCVILCNEHVANLGEQEKKPESTGSFLPHQNNLCDTCIHSSSCVFKQKNLKTVFCEEYA